MPDPFADLSPAQRHQIHDAHARAKERRAATATRTLPWEYETGTDFDALPRDTNPRLPDGRCCEANWAGAESDGMSWKCTMPPGHEPQPHRAGNGSEILAEWPADSPEGAPRP